MRNASHPEHTIRAAPMARTEADRRDGDADQPNAAATTARVGEPTR